ETAYSAMLQAEATIATLASDAGAMLVLERAQLHWARGDQHEALLQLHNDMAAIASTQTEAAKQGALLVADWMAETSRFATKDVLQQYDSVKAQFPYWDRSHHAMAKYMDQLLSVGDLKEDEFLPQVIKHYCCTLI